MSQAEGTDLSQTGEIDTSQTEGTDSSQAGEIDTSQTDRTDPSQAGETDSLTACKVFCPPACNVPSPPAYSVLKGSCPTPARDSQDCSPSNKLPLAGGGSEK